MKVWNGQSIKIVSERTLLCSLRLSDAKDILDWVNKKDIFGHFQFFSGEKTVEDEKRYVSKMNESSSDLIFGIANNKGDLIGTCGLHEIDLNNMNARIGIVIGDESYWNQGYAKEVLRALIGWAFSKMGLKKVYLTPFSENEKALHLYSCVGFQKEGILRGEYRLGEDYKDLVRMSILREEWQDAKRDKKGSNLDSYVKKESK